MTIHLLTTVALVDYSLEPLFNSVLQVYISREILLILSMTQLSLKCVLKLRWVFFLHPTATKCWKRLILMLFGWQILIFIQTNLYQLSFYRLSKLNSSVVCIKYHMVHLNSRFHTSEGPCRQEWEQASVFVLMIFKECIIKSFNSLQLGTKLNTEYVETIRQPFEVNHLIIVQFVWRLSSCHINFVVISVLLVYKVLNDWIMFLLLYDFDETSLYLVQVVSYQRDKFSEILGHCQVH